jgi:type I restriction enzyme S subunit
VSHAWTTVSIGDLCQSGDVELQTGPFGSQLHSYDYLPEGVPVVPTEAIANGRLDHSVLPKISTEKAASLGRHVLKPSDILFARRGVQATGKTALIRPDEAGFICGTGAIRLRVKSKSSKLDPVYLACLLNDQASIDWFKFHAIGATMPNLNEGIIRAFNFSLPALPEQRVIAATLGALDDKIELNRKMNATLEAMARALFRDWFVDFGPTRARMEARAPYLSPDLWSVFPDRLDEEGKPEGWEVFRLGDLADHHTRTISPSEHPSELFEHFSLPAYDKGQSPALDHGATIKSNKTLIPTGAILLSKLNPEIARVWLPEASTGHTQIASTEFLAYTGKNGVGRGLLFCLFSDDDFRTMLHAMVTGTSKSHQRISPPDLLRREALVGNAAMFRSFQEVVSPLLDRVLANRSESRTLAQTRDLLLPRLMSGEIRIRDTERLVEEAG